MFKVETLCGWSGSGEESGNFLGYFGGGVTTRGVSSGSIMVSTGSCSPLTWWHCQQVSRFGGLAGTTMLVWLYRSIQRGPG